jgi:hypothetical protein
VSGRPGSTGLGGSGVRRPVDRLGGSGCQDDLVRQVGDRGVRRPGSTGSSDRGCQGDLVMVVILR